MTPGLRCEARYPELMSSNGLAGRDPSAALGQRSTALAPPPAAAARVTGSATRLVKGPRMSNQQRRTF